MKHFALIVGLLLVAAPAGAQQLTEEERKDGFVSLFNGKDWSGWQFGGGYGIAEKVPANWSLGDGLIKLSGGGAPHLGTQWDYDDFEFRLEWRAVKPKANYNSGVYIRSGRKVGANQLNLAKGGEGGPVGLKAKGAKAVPTLQKPAGDWNEWKVRVVGDKIALWCNGELGFEATEFATLKPGYLGLQAEGAAMEFRNLRVKEIGWERLDVPAAWSSFAESKWRQEGDALVGSPMRLTSVKKDYKNYVLRFEWKNQKKEEGAVELRGTKEISVFVGNDLPAPEKWPANPPGQWNYMEIKVTDGKVHTWLNGVSPGNGPADLSKTLPESGPLGLVGDGIQFRNIRVKALAN